MVDFGLRSVCGMIKKEGGRGNVRGKDACEEISGDSGNGMDGKDVERVVTVYKIFELRRKVGRRCTCDAEDDTCPWWDKSGAGGDGDQSRDDS